MADITMCLNKECPSKELCYRYTAVETPGWQAYADFKVSKGEDKCNNYWPNDGYRNKKFGRRNDMRGTSHGPLR